ncbi:MAG: M48 family metalloprotease [Alcanivoracaceae bacterium]|jgi:predicted Zn-dependent protease|nr:M48 family metalloprotease [Alcanivoracaceae bacterium]
MVRLLILLVLYLPTSAIGDEPAPLPELGDPAGGLISPDQEFRMGRTWLRQLRGQVATLNDPLVQEYVEHLVYRMASHSDLHEPDLAIVVINNRDINAFAVPGGVIGLNAGLLVNAEREDEVAAVIAHEIAHVSQRHFVRRYADSQRINTAVMAAMLASLAVMISGQADAGVAGLMATQAAAIQQQLAYSRHHEREADRVGMQTLVNAGMDPQAMPRFFERLQRNQQFAGKPLEFLSTHPITEERIADSRARADTLPAGNLAEAEAFHLIRARLLAGFHSTPALAVEHFRSQYNQGATIQQQAAGYGLAISALRAKDYVLANQTLAGLEKRFPDQLWYRVARAEVLQAQQKHAQAAEILREVAALVPRNYAITALLAGSLIKTDKAAEAAELLEPILRRRASDPALWRLAADAWGYSGNLAMAHLGRGEALFLSGADERGIDQLRYALEYSKDNFPLHSRIKARVKEMEAISKERF